MQAPCDLRVTNIPQLRTLNASSGSLIAAALDAAFIHTSHHPISFRVSRTLHLRLYHPESTCVFPPTMFNQLEDDHGPGAGSALNPILLTFAGISTLVATVVSAMSIYLHLKNYRKPHLQRYAMFPMALRSLSFCSRSTTALGWSFESC